MPKIENTAQKAHAHKMNAPEATEPAVRCVSCPGWPNAGREEAAADALCTFKHDDALVVEQQQRKRAETGSEGIEMNAYVRKFIDN